MKKLLSIFLLALASLCIENTHAAPAKGSAGTIADFIEANRRNREVVLNNPKYDKNAKVYYLYRLYYHGYKSSHFKAYTEFLTQAQRRIFNKGADLIVLLNVDEDKRESKERARNSYYHFDIYKEAKQSSLKSPMLNSNNKKVRKELYKESDSGYTYQSSTLIATDADGKTLATFSYYDKELKMTDVSTRKSKILAEGKFEARDWVVEAIIRSYKELVAQATPPEEPPAEKPAKKSPEAKKKQPITQKTKWRKVETNTETEDDEED